MGNTFFLLKSFVVLLFLNFNFTVFSNIQSLIVRPPECKSDDIECKCDKAVEKVEEIEKDFNNACANFGGVNCEEKIASCETCSTKKDDEEIDSCLDFGKKAFCPLNGSEYMKEAKEKLEESEEKIINLEEKIAELEERKQEKESELLVKEAEYKEDLNTLKEEHLREQKGMKEDLDRELEELKGITAEKQAEVKKALGVIFKREIDISERLIALNQAKLDKVKIAHLRCEGVASTKLDEYKAKVRRTEEKQKLTSVLNLKTYIPRKVRYRAHYKKHYFKCYSEALERVEIDYQTGLRQIKNEEAIFNNELSKLQKELETLATDNEGKSSKLNGNTLKERKEKLALYNQTIKQKRTAYEKLDRHRRGLLQQLISNIQKEKGKLAQEKRKEISQNAITEYLKSEGVSDTGSKSDNPFVEALSNKRTLTSSHFSAKETCQCDKKSDDGKDSCSKLVRIEQRAKLTDVKEGDSNSEKNSSGTK